MQTEYKLIGTNSVKRLVDGACIPFADGNRDYEQYKLWLEEGNTPEPEFSLEQLDAQRISQIKAKASELILNKYSIYWQLNHPRLDITYVDEYKWIDNIRAISNQAELDGTSLENIDWGI